VSAWVQAFERHHEAVDRFGNSGNTPNLRNSHVDKLAEESYIARHGDRLGWSAKWLLWLFRIEIYNLPKL
jgi:hypothetical protein